MDTLRSAIWSVVKRFVIAIISTLGIVTLFGFILDKLESLINAKLYGTFGNGTVLFTATIGTPLHEISHWIGCKIFGFEVSKVELLRPNGYKTDGILGYVQYSYNQDSLWQKFGCFFVGIAPMILGVLFILLFTWLLKPEIYAEIKSKVNDASRGVKNPSFLAVAWAGFSGFWKGLFTVKKWGWLRSIICLYIVMSISMHMTISEADIEGAKAGIWIVLALYGIFAVITAMIGNDCIIPGAKTAAFFTAFFSIGLISDAFLLVLSLLFSGVGNFKGLDYLFDKTFNTVNLNKYITVSTEGYDHYGTLTVDFDSDKFIKKYGDKINENLIDNMTQSFQIDSGEKEQLNQYIEESDTASLLVAYIGKPTANKTSNLSNGEIVTLTWADDYGFWGFSNIEEMLKEYTGKNFKHEDYEYKVKGLKTVETFDPFSELTWSVNGISGMGEFALDLNSASERLKALEFRPTYKTCVNNGDTISVETNIYNVDEYVEKYNCLPYPTEMEYTIDGLDYYVTDINDIDESILTELNNSAEEVAKSSSESWVEECKITSAECVGYIFLSKTNQSYQLNHNRYVPVIKIHVVGDLEPELEFDYYYTVEYGDFLIEEGNCTYKDSYSVPMFSKFTKAGEFIGKDDNSYSELYFDGFESIEDVKSYYISPNSEYDIQEDKMK